MLVFRAGIHKVLVRIANREGGKTLIRLLLQKQSDLGLHCLPRLLNGRQLVLEVVEHLPYIEKCLCIDNLQCVYGSHKFEITVSTDQ